MKEKKIKNNAEEIFIERKCPVCGKVFFPAPYHVYKVNDKLACSYSCVVLYRKMIQDKAKFRNSRRISQYALNGDFVKTYSSVSKAQEETGIDSTCIYQNARGCSISAGGYIWRYVDDKK